MLARLKTLYANRYTQQLLWTVSPILGICLYAAFIYFYLVPAALTYKHPAMAVSALAAMFVPTAFMFFTLRNDIARWTLNMHDRELLQIISHADIVSTVRPGIIIKRWLADICHDVTLDALCGPLGATHPDTDLRSPDQTKHSYIVRNVVGVIVRLRILWLHPEFTHDHNFRPFILNNPRLYYALKPLCDKMS